MLKFLLYLLICVCLVVFNTSVLNVCFGHEKHSFRHEKRALHRHYKHRHHDIDIQIAEDTFIQNNTSKRR